MLDALVLAVTQLAEPELRRPLIETLLWTCVIVAALCALVFQQIRHLASGLGNYGTVVAAASFVLLGIAAWLLFAVVENTILLCYTDRIAAAVERRHYPFLPPPRGVRWRDMMWSGLRLTFLTLALNVVALPLYVLLPGVNLVLFLALNGYLLGRSYYDAIVLRRLDDGDARRVWREHRGVFFVNGAVSAMLLTVPLVNLVAPIVGLAMTVHLFERRRGAAWSQQISAAEGR